MVMMWLVRMKVIRRIEGVVEGAEELVGRGVDGGEFGEDLLRGLGGIDLFGDAGELGLVLMQVGEGDLEQVVERKSRPSRHS